VSKRLLFVGVSSMKDHAGQDKLYFLSDELARKGVPVTVLVPDLQENRAFFADKPYVEAMFYPGGWAVGDAWRKTQMIGKGKWSAVWLVGVGIRSYVFKTPFSQEFPIIKDFDEFPSMIESAGALRRAYLRFFERRMIYQAEGFTCASAFLEDAVRKLRPDIGSRLLRLPVAIGSDEQKTDPAFLQRLMDASEGRAILLYVGSIGRLYEEQLDELIQLAVILKRRKSNAIVRIAGSGPDMEYFKAKAAAADIGGHLEFIGHVSRSGNLAAHMKAARVLIFPFPSSPFNISRCPTKAFHYAAANRPLVTNRVGEVAALFKDKAFYYPERDVEAMADQCIEAIRSADTYDNGISFPSLTWAERSTRFHEWLKAQSWAPSSREQPLEIA
jgi:glycosyltransferase involved in cell wall biosynthesis